MIVVHGLLGWWALHVAVYDNGSPNFDFVLDLEVPDHLKLAHDLDFSS